MRLSLPDSKYHERAHVSTFLKDLQNGLQAVPGVTDVGFSTCPLVSVPGFCPDTVFQIEGHPSPSGHLNDAEYKEVSPAFFRATGVPLLAGRTFTERDGIGLDDQRPHSGQVVVNRSFAQHFFPSENALGKYIELYWFIGNNPKQALVKYEIVGMVGDALERPDAATQPIFYLPIFDGDSDDINIVLHTADTGTRVSARAQSIIHRLDSDLAVFGVQTVDELVSDTIQGRRYMAGLFGAFAILAIVLATVGLYGVVSSGVLQRRNEIAVRIAVGASGTDIAKMILLRGFRPTIVGIVVGIPCALVAVRFLRSLLFEIRPSDPYSKRTPETVL
jgi:ABC-type antimicrobial peptide transport system permease subunit